MLKIQRALVSVSNKTHMDVLANILVHYNIDTLSTGGTSKILRDKGCTVQDVADYTGFPEMMDGRVKTLHPKIHGGLLACMDNNEHTKSMQDHGIESIDLVVVNLYPFEETLRQGASYQELIEKIDIGGPSMVRSAAKNHQFTLIITDPEDYDALAEELARNEGAVSYEFRQQMAAKAFAHTAYYDGKISSWFAKELGNDFPQTLHVTASLKQHLRYGENPHQLAAFYVANPEGIGHASQIHGKELSYNNIHDADAALQLVKEFDKPACVMIKHTNPCGVGVASTLDEAYDKALASDPVSAFGGIFALNRPITSDIAQKISSMFVEAVIAPSFDHEAKDILCKKKNLRLLEVPIDHQVEYPWHIKSIEGGLLVQGIDALDVDDKELQVVTKRAPSDEEMENLRFAFKICKHVKSNAIVLAKDLSTVGVGAGQMSRVDASKIAAIKAADNDGGVNRAEGAVLASDAFFPFADGVLQAAKAGVKAIIQPGGSIRDEEVIDAANAHDIAMVFTSIRHFKH